MCGHAGFVGITDPQKRYALVSSLGTGIDARGGDACGFVSLSNKGFQVGKKLGYWSERRRTFVERAANARLTMMHSRWATCGKNTVDEAHPFAVKRGGRIVLYGAHNGRVYNGYQSARKHGRDIAVDSQEIFELLADNDYDGIRNLEGYGVITWINTKDPDKINLLRLSEDSEIYVVETKDRKVVYGSTPVIVHSALKSAGLEHKDWFIINVGTVYSLRNNGVYLTNTTGVIFKEQEVIVPEYDNGIDWASKWLHSVEAYNNISKERKQGKKKSRISKKDGNVRCLGTLGKQEDFIDLNELFDLACDNCGDYIEEDDLDELSFLYEEHTGRKVTGVYCKSCIMVSVN
jgi:predicted glutamine amidotransferase